MTKKQPYTEESNIEAFKQFTERSLRGGVPPCTASRLASRGAASAARRYSAPGSCPHRADFYSATNLNVSLPDALYRSHEDLFTVFPGTTLVPLTQQRRMAPTPKGRSAIPCKMA